MNSYSFEILREFEAVTDSHLTYIPAVAIVFLFYEIAVVVVPRRVDKLGALDSAFAMTAYAAILGGSLLNAVAIRMAFISLCRLLGIQGFFDVIKQAIQVTVGGIVNAEDLISQLYL